jgi:hypothetical protein
MNLPGDAAEWYYVGHYGQLGPLTLDQVSELAQDGVIGVDTYVWKQGMSDWRQAREVIELRGYLSSGITEAAPPPTPVVTPPPSRSWQPLGPMATPTRSEGFPLGHGAWPSVGIAAPLSDKNRTVAGLLNFLPGFGRFYLGYAAHGALQLFTAMMCGIGFIWSIIDGIYILAGGVKFDGYGRRLED